TPGYAINALLEKTGKTIEDIDLFEINEAFAAVAIASTEIAGIDPEKLNVNGGAGDNRMRKLASGNSAITYDARWSLAGHLPARSPSR
ncbi:hypothetical protein ACUN9W_30095, partial [Escherichia coli]